MRDNVCEFGSQLRGGGPVGQVPLRRRERRGVLSRRDTTFRTRVPAHRFIFNDKFKPVKVEKVSFSEHNILLVKSYVMIYTVDCSLSEIH